MEGGTRLAIAILMIFLAMVAFFFAFHPGGVENVKNPDTALQWLMGEFDNTASSTPANLTPASKVNTSVPSTNLTNVPGTNIGPSLWLRTCKSKVYQFRLGSGGRMFRLKPDLLSNREVRMRHRLEMQRAIADVLGVPVTTIRLPSVKMLREALAEASERLKPSS